MDLSITKVFIAEPRAVFDAFPTAALDGRRIHFRIVFNFVEMSMSLQKTRFDSDF